MRSPNQSSRLFGGDGVRLIVCHTPEGGDSGTIATIMDPKAEVSYHRLYLAGGAEAIQFVEFDRKAWHAKVYNSMSDGLAVHGWARHFDLRDASVKAFAHGVAERCIARGVKPQWTTDSQKGGFCRHKDIQSDREDPTPDTAEWRLFVGMVQAAHHALTNGKPKKPWPIPVPRWYWQWALWRMRGRKGSRPASAPRIIPLWAWRRLRAQERARQL